MVTLESSTSYFHKESSVQPWALWVTSWLQQQHLPPARPIFLKDFARGIMIVRTRPIYSQLLFGVPCKRMRVSYPKDIVVDSRHLQFQQQLERHTGAHGDKRWIPLKK